MADLRDAAQAEIPTIDPRHDGRFRDLTCRGNRAFAAGREAEADRLYREALAEAEGLLDLATRDLGAGLVAPMALTIAAHNLAVATARAGDGKAARAISVEAAERLIGLADRVRTPIALRLNCLRHLRHALAFLADLDGTGEATARLGARAAEVGAEIVRVAGVWNRTAAARGATPGGERLAS